MSASLSPAVAKRSRLAFAAGLLAGLLLLLLLGEAAMRLRPPGNIHEFLGDASPLSKTIYRPDPDLYVNYRSADLFRPAESPMLADVPKNSAKPTWVFFGVSFGVAISRTAERLIPSRRVLFFREVGDRLHMRIAQARMILDYGIKAERMVFVLIPLEIARYTQTPLESVYVNKNGAITYRIRKPPAPFSWLVDHSRLALVAWVRSRQHNWLPFFRLSRITEEVPPLVEQDFRHMFGELEKLQREYGVAVTVVVLPDRRQVLYDDSAYVLQKKFAALGKEAGIDIYDPVELMRAQPKRWALFVPDWHYTEAGYELVTNGLADHIARLTKDTRARGDLSR